MGTTMIRRARLAAIAAAALGLSACAGTESGSALDKFVAAMRDANATTRTAQADHSAVPTPAADEVPAPKPVAAEAAQAPTPAPIPAPAQPVLQPAALAVSAPAAKAAAAHPPAEPGRTASSAEIAALQHQLSELEGRVAALSAENQRQMERLSLMTNGAIADMEQLFNALRLELRSAPSGEPAAAPAPKRRPVSRNQALPSGQGGPFLPWPPKAATLASGDRVEPLPDLQNLFLMHQIVMALPLAPPLNEAVVTGPFGHRRDPFNRRSAFHDGIDLQAPMRTPVHAAEAGIVVAAGLRPAYGRVVEIDHGFGIRTRYAHLAALGVREGDRVERNATIGALGSSGRSASPHLHYEVLFNGRPHDPADLLVLAEGIRSLR